MSVHLKDLGIIGCIYPDGPQLNHANALPALTPEQKMVSWHERTFVFIEDGQDLPFLAASYRFTEGETRFD